MILVFNVKDKINNGYKNLENSQNSNWGPIGNLIGNNSQVHFSFTYRTN